MKRISAALLGAVMVLCLCACSVLPSDIQNIISVEGEKTEQGSEALPAEDEGNIIHLAMDPGCASLNYYKNTGSTAEEISVNTIEGLTVPVREGESRSGCALSWNPGENGSVWTFRLRHDAVWVDNNGNATEYTVTAQDFVSSLKYAAEPENAHMLDENVRSMIVGLDDYCRALEAAANGIEGVRSRQEVLDSFESTVGVAAIDSYTVQYTLTSPVPYFLSVEESSAAFRPLCTEYAAEQKELYASDCEHMLYCGPYFVSRFEKEKSAILTKNNLYCEADSVIPDRIEYSADSSRSDAERFLAGELDYAHLSEDDYLAIQDRNDVDGLVASENVLSTQCLWLNFSGANDEFRVFVQNADFRKALKTAINKYNLSYLRDPVDPSAAFRSLLNPPGCFYSDAGVDYTELAPFEAFNESVADDVSPREYMLKAVMDLADANGVIVGCESSSVDYQPVSQFDVDGCLPVSICYVCSDSDDDIAFAHLIRNMLEEAIGRDFIDVEIVCLADLERGGILEGGRFDIYCGSLACEVADPAGILSGFVTEGRLNYGGFSIDAFDSEVNISAFFGDTDARLDSLASAEALLCGENYLIPLTSTGCSYCLTSIDLSTAPRNHSGLRLLQSAVCSAWNRENEQEGYQQ